MNCPNCGVEVLPGQLFCENCGFNLHTGMRAEPAQPEGTANRTPCPDACNGVLRVKNGDASFKLPAGSEVVVGRVDPVDGIYPDIDLTPFDPALVVSRRHAMLHEQGGQWYIRDLNSTNYTVVNRHRVNPDQDYLIEDGDEIRFGRVIAVFKIE